MTAVLYHYGRGTQESIWGLPIQQDVSITLAGGPLIRRVTADLCAAHTSAQNASMLSHNIRQSDSCCLIPEEAESHQTDCLKLYLQVLLCCSLWSLYNVLNEQADEKAQLEVGAIISMSSSCLSL